MSVSEHPTTTGGRYLKRGDSFDIEDWRTTHRLQVAQSILRNLGFTPTWVEHDPKCIKHPDNAWNRVFGFNYICDTGCPRKSNPPPTWPEGASGEVFDAAYRLADAVQNARHANTMTAINKIQREKEQRRREEREAQQS